MSVKNIVLANTVSLNFFKQTLEHCEYLCRRQSDCLFFRDNIDVEICPDGILVWSKIFAKQPFDPIPGNRIPNPFGYSDTKARPSMVTGIKQNDEVRVLYSSPGLWKVYELRTFS